MDFGGRHDLRHVLVGPRRLHGSISMNQTRFFGLACDKCAKRVHALYGVPTGEMTHMPDPMAPKWCYECWTESYGPTDEDIEAAEEVIDYDTLKAVNEA